MVILRTVLLLCLFGIALSAQTPQAIPGGAGGGGAGTGTVTNVATSCGLTGGPITTTGTLQDSISIAAHNGDYTVLTGDCGKSLTSNIAANDTLPQAGSAGFAAGWYVQRCNVGASGNVVISTTTSAFYGNGGTGSTSTVKPGSCATLASNGTDWLVMAYTASPISATAPITISAANVIACTTCGVTGSPLSQFASTTSAQLAGVISDESGSGPLIFGTSPTISLASASTAVTQTPSDNSTKVATTAYADAVGAASVPTGRTISTSSPLGGGGALSSNLTLACATCTTNASPLVSTAFVTGAGGQASQTPSATATLDGSGAAAFPGGITTGGASGVAGIDQCQQGTTPVIKANAFGFACPITMTTSVIRVPPNSVPAAGTVMLAGATSGGFTPWTDVTLSTGGQTSKGTMTTVYHGNVGGDGSFGPVVLTTDVSGVTPVANGGTATSSTLSGIMRGGNPMTASELSGDVITSGSNATTIANNAITNAKIANSTIDLTTKVTGTLPVANGGTGITSLGSGVATALGAAVSGTGSFCLTSGSSCSGAAAGSGVSVVNKTAVTVNANTTSAQVLQQISLTAGYLNTASASFNLHGSGVDTIGVAQIPTLTYVANLCTVSGCGSGTVIPLATMTTAATTAATNDTWVMEFKIVTDTAGSSGKVTTKGKLFTDIGATPGAAATTYLDGNAATSSAIDLTAALFIQFTVATSVGSGTNSITQMLEVLDPQVGATVSSVGNQTGAVPGIGNGTSVQMAGAGTPTNNNFVQFDANSNTIDSGKAKPTGTVLGTTDTQTLTNKRITPRVDNQSGAATTYTPNGDSFDVIEMITSTSTGFTWVAPSGTPTDGQKLWLKMQCTNAAAQTLTWPAGIVGGTDVPLPAQCTGNSKIDMLGMGYDTINSKWEMLAVARGY